VDLVRGTYAGPTAGRIRVGEWADQWLIGARNLKERGLDTYRRDLDRHILDDYLTIKLDAGHSASTVHRHYRTLHRLCEGAIERGKITRPPKRSWRWPAPSAGGTGPGSSRRRMPAFVGWRESACAGATSPVYRITISEQLVKRASGRFDRETPEFLVEELAEHMCRAPLIPAFDEIVAWSAACRRSIQHPSLATGTGGSVPRIIAPCRDLLLRIGREWAGLRCRRSGIAPDGSSGEARAHASQRGQCA
jgi:hypothetical protein